MTDKVFSKPYFAQLSDEGVAYVREHLSQGEEFAQLVLTNIDVGNGTTYLNVTSQDIQDAFYRHHPLHQHTR